MQLKIDGEINMHRRADGLPAITNIGARKYDIFLKNPHCLIIQYNPLWLQ
jgi:hypothetical protein